MNSFFKYFTPLLNNGLGHVPMKKLLPLFNAISLHLGNLKSCYENCNIRYVSMGTVFVVNKGVWSSAITALEPFKIPIGRDLDLSEQFPNLSELLYRFSSDSCCFLYKMD